MATAMIAGLMALGLTMPQAAPARSPGPTPEQFQAEQNARPRTIYDHVLILGRGRNDYTPSCGLFASQIAIMGRLSSGETTYFYEFWCFAGQAAPPPSGLCRITVLFEPGVDGFVSGENDWPTGPDDPASRTFIRKEVDRFDCTISSDGPPIVPVQERSRRTPVRDAAAARPTPTSRPLTFLRTYELATTDVTFDDILVTRISDRPAAGSGYVTSWVTVTGVTPAGEPLTWAITYMGEGQPLPPVSGRCRFVSAPPMTGLADLPALAGAAMIVRRFDCTISSDSPTIPPEA